ncbi:MAG: hypothetical protein KatS3mg002_1670 [Candidatus Woesearchaeota archaeon]|nr:MAG: hypothetical protein KatS3mg002_1670 [Candidatus Woesearchaeota archaeon]
MFNEIEIFDNAYLTCKECGARIEYDWEYCIVCGKEIGLPNDDSDNDGEISDNDLPF